MKVQVTTVIALLATTAAAMPTPQTDSHGLAIDTDDWVDDGSLDALEARALEPDTDDRVEDNPLDHLDTRGFAYNPAADNFNFTTDFDFALDLLLAEIDEIPDEVLEQGDEALHQWLVAHGYRPSSENLKRDVGRGAPAPSDTSGDDVDSRSLIERGELVVRASVWKITKCVAAIVQLLATTAVPATKLLRIKKYIKALGGAKQAVKLMLGATTRAEKLRAGGEVLVALSAELLGISTVKNNCF